MDDMWCFCKSPPKSFTFLLVKFSIGRERHRIQDHLAGMVILKFIFHEHHLFIPAETVIIVNRMRGRVCRWTWLQIAWTIPKCRQPKAGCMYLIMPYNIIRCFKWLKSEAARNMAVGGVLIEWSGALFLSSSVSKVCKDLKLDLSSTVSHAPSSSVF